MQDDMDGGGKARYYLITNQLPWLRDARALEHLFGAAELINNSIVSIVNNRMGLLIILFLTIELIID